MHEAGLMLEVIDAVTEAAGGATVRRVVLEVGGLAAVVPAALRFAFEGMKTNTVLEHAELTIVEVPGAARCDDCGARVRMEELLGSCACGSTRLTIVAGDALLLKSIEVD